MMGQHFNLKWNSVKRVLLCIVLALGALTVFALWEGSGSVRAQEVTSGKTTLLAASPIGGTCGENLTWNFVLGTGVLTISGTGEMENYDTSYDVPWRYYRENIQSLVLEVGVTSIGDNAFSGCSGVTGELVLPESVVSIGDHAFSRCSGFTGDLIIPASVVSIGNYAFYNCSGFAGKLTISKGVASIGNYAFYCCSNFTDNLMIPESVTSIGSSAFYGCSGFNGELIISEGVVSIGEYAFSYCNGFTGNLVIPESVTSIGRGAFLLCTGFTGNLLIPGSVISIGEYAFQKCSSFAGDLILSNGVTYIGSLAFSGCSGFTGSLVLPKSVTSIGVAAFSVCSGFSGDLVIPESVTSIGDSAFNCCDGFNGELIISDGVISIGEYAFSNCSGFTGDLVIPGSVTSIGDSAFRECTGFTGNLIISEGVASIGAEAFRFLENSSFTGDLVIPGSVISIGESAFDGCGSFTGSLKISDGVTIIGARAFYDCSGFTGDLLIPKSVTSIGDSAFGECSSFAGNLVISEGTTSIGESAFSGCNDFTKVVLPMSINTIGSYAFRSFSKLTDVYYAGSLEDWEQISIGYANSYLTNATIHYYSSGPGTLPTNVCSMIGVLEEYDAQSREILLFDHEHDIYHYPVTDSTDLSFLDQLDSMIGKPILLRYIPGEYGVETLTRYVWSIEPVTPRLGTLESLGDNVLILDGRIYFHALNDPDGFEWCVENEVVCYLDSQDTVLSLTMLRKSSGTLDSGTASSATIDSLSHPVFCEGVPPYLPAPELWLGREVTYWSANELIFRLELQPYTDTYHRRLDRLEDRTAYFHDGSQYVLADGMNADESLVGHWVKLVLETSSNGAQLVEMELLKPRVTVDIALDNGGAIQFNGRKFSFGDDNYASSSQFEIAYTITIHNTPAHDSEEDLALMMRDSSLNLTLEELRIGTSAGFNTGIFGGGKPPKVAGTVLSAGETYTTGGYIRPSGVSYFRNKQRMTETISARLQSSAENGDALGSTSFTVTNLDYQAETSAEIKDLSQEAANELANMDIDQVIVLSAFDLLYNDFGLSTKDVKALQQHILTTLSLCAMPEDTIQEEITQSVLDKLKASFALSSKRQTVTLHYQFETEKYGVLHVDLICKLSNFILNDSEFALTGALSYQITNPPAALRHKQEGKFGAINQYDIKAFADAAYALAEKVIKKGSYDETVGNAANQVADMIFSETTKAILSRLGYKPSELLWKLMTWPTKSYRIACPVDVFVYDSAGNRCGAIVGGLVAKVPDASFELQEEGDVKYILNLEDGYQVQCVAYSFGTMNVDISEGGGYEQPVRLISFQDVPLVPQEKFTQNAPDGIGEDVSQYTLASSGYDGTSVRPADSEELLVHLAADYVPPEIEPSFEFSLKTHTSTSAEIEISNTAEEDINASFVVSAYNSEGKMIACQVIQKELDTLESLSLSVSWGQDDEIAVVRGFAVDANTKAPLCGQWEQAIS